MKNNILGVDLKIDQEYIGRCVEEVVKAGMIEALNMKDNIAEQCVKTILTQKVDENGNPYSGYYEKDKLNLLEYHLRKAVEECTKEEIKTAFQEKKEDIKVLIRKELSKKGTLDRFVSSFFTNIHDTLERSWATKIDIKFEEIKERDF